MASHTHHSSHSSHHSSGHHTPSGSSGSAKSTTDHDVIRRWAEDRGGKPASVKGTEKKGECAGLLRIDFPGYSGEQSLEHITWDEFFDKFEESNLAFLYQEEAKGGRDSRFFKLIAREDKPHAHKNPRD